MRSNLHAILENRWRRERQIRAGALASGGGQEAVLQPENLLRWGFDKQALDRHRRSLCL